MIDERLVGQKARNELFKQVFEMKNKARTDVGPSSLLLLLLNELNEYILGRKASSSWLCFGFIWQKN